MVLVRQKAELRLALDQRPVLDVDLLGQERLDRVDADGEDHVGLSQDALGRLERRKAEDAEHAQRVRMRLVDDALAVERRDDRCAQPLGQLLDRRRRSRPPGGRRRSAAARTARAPPPRCRAPARAAASGSAPAASVPGRCGNAPRPARSRSSSTSDGTARCTARCCCTARPTKLRRSAASWPGWMQSALCGQHRAEEVRLVDVLELPVPDLRGRHQPGEQQERHPVEVGVDHPAQRVERAGARGRDADAELRRSAAHARPPPSPPSSRGASAPSAPRSAARAPQGVAPAAIPDSRRRAAPRASPGRRRCGRRRSKAPFPEPASDPTPDRGSGKPRQGAFGLTHPCRSSVWQSRPPGAIRCGRTAEDGQLTVSQPTRRIVVAALGAGLVAAPSERRKAAEGAEIGCTPYCPAERTYSVHTHRALRGWAQASRRRAAPGRGVGASGGDGPRFMVTLRRTAFFSVTVQERPPRGGGRALPGGAKAPCSGRATAPAWERSRGGGARPSDPATRPRREAPDRGWARAAVTVRGL